MTQTMQLSEQPIAIKTELPGPIARDMIAKERPFVSPSLIDYLPLMVKRASGCMIEDMDGNVLLDMQAGIATNSTGHCHPKVVKAIQEQAEVLLHICGTDFHYPGYGRLCEILDRLAPGTEPWQSFLTNSGTEGIEAAIKLARFHTGRSNLIAFRGAFHGRSMGAVTLTGSKPKYRKGFGPMLYGVHHVDYFHGKRCRVGRAPAECAVQCLRDSIEGDLFSHTVDPSEVAAIFVEPIQGEGGYIVPHKAFLHELRALCDRHGILLVFDEVQSGMGRTGKMLASEHFGVTPDIIVLAKGLASGMPLGAMMARKSVMTWGPGTHGSTIGGNPVSIAAALASIELLETELCANAAKVGDHLMARLRASLYPDTKGQHGVDEVRGLGLMIGVEFDTPELAGKVAQLCYQRGMIVLECGHKTIRLAPPLVLSQAQSDLAADIFIQACRDVAKV
ncbi:MAG TPA: aminotransferase class III-fold pyridoxal phosphate-dependent enzyme [Candidatus Xenobia bacterium]|jgi:4-aminobutyrate aminotransferase